MPNKQIRDSQLARLAEVGGDFDPAKPPKDPYTKQPYGSRLGDGDGLHLKLAPKRGHSHGWNFDYSRPAAVIVANPTLGKRNTLRIGIFPHVSVEMARAKAAEFNAMLAKGIDPGLHKIETKTATKEAVIAATLIDAKDWKGQRIQLVPNSFEFHARNYVEKRCTPNAQGRRELGEDREALWKGSLELHVFPHIGSKLIREITAEDAFRVLEIIDNKGTTAILDEVRRMMKKVFDYAIKRYHLDVNPMIRIDNDALTKHTKGNHPAIIEPVQLRELMVKLDAYGGTLEVKGALRMQLLIWQRPGMVRFMRWTQIIEAGKHWIWKIARDEMKDDAEGKATGEDHDIVLPPQAVELLKAMKYQTGNCEYVFPSPRNKRNPIGESTMNEALRLMGFYRVQVSHGFRSTATTMMQEYLGIDKRILDAHMDHANGDDLGTAYDRAKWKLQRALAARAWPDYLDRLMANDPKCYEPYVIQALQHVLDQEEEKASYLALVPKAA